MPKSRIHSPVSLDIAMPINNITKQNLEKMIQICLNRECKRRFKTTRGGLRYCPQCTERMEKTARECLVEKEYPSKDLPKYFTEPTETFINQI